MAKKNIIDNNLPSEKFVISLTKQHFERFYGIYILELIFNNKRIYFIESLNDSLNIANKLAIRKIASHLDDTASARNNRLYKYILNEFIEVGKNPDRKITDKHKQQIEDFLTETELKLHVYPLIKFNFDTISKKEHKDNSLKVKNFEKQVIRMFARADKKLMNENIEDEYVRYDEIAFPKIWEQIKIDFYI